MAGNLTGSQVLVAGPLMHFPPTPEMRAAVESQGPKLLQLIEKQNQTVKAAERIDSARSVSRRYGHMTSNSLLELSPKLKDSMQLAFRETPNTVQSQPGSGSAVRGPVGMAPGLAGIEQGPAQPAVSVSVSTAVVTAVQSVLEFRPALLSDAVPAALSEPAHELLSNLRPTTFGQK